VPRTLLLATVQRAFAQAAEVSEGRTKADWFERPRSRREVLQGAAAAVAVGTAWSALGCGSSNPPEHDETIVVVGARADRRARR
jgi:hypothetical protein